MGKLDENIRRISSPDELKIEACMNLVADLLRQAAIDYKDSLKFIKGKEKMYSDWLAEYDRRHECRYVIKKYWQMIKRKELYKEKNGVDEAYNERETKLLEEYLWWKKNKPVSLSLKKSSTIRKYEEAVKTAQDCECFYKSELIGIFTLGFKTDGKDIIEKIRREVGYAS